MHLVVPQVHIVVSSNDFLQWLVAIGTIAAASATAWMALKTRKLAYETKTMALETKSVAEATMREAVAVELQGQHIALQAEATAATLKAAVLPWITSQHSEEYEQITGGVGFRPGVALADGPDGIQGEVLIRNVGPGIALIDASESWAYEGGSTSDVRVKLHTAKPVLPPGETAWLMFTVAKTTATWVDMTVERFTKQQQTFGTFSLLVVYSDVASAASWRARLSIAATERQEWWFVHQIDYFEGPAEDPAFTVLLHSDGL